MVQPHPANTNKLLDFVQAVHNPSMRKIDSAVIWLHGLGANGHDFAPIVPELRLPVDLSVRFIFPHAPSIPVAINGNHVMPAWYNLLSIAPERKFDQNQLLESVEAINGFIDALVADGIPAERIVIAGFSQGGAVAYETALAQPQKLAGLIALSTYFATKDSSTLSEVNKTMPIFIGHGTQDTVVDESLGQEARAFLQKEGYKAHYRTYPTDHGVFAQEVLDLGAFIGHCLKK